MAERAAAEKNRPREERGERRAGGGTRTLGPRLTRSLLYQLSYPGGGVIVRATSCCLFWTRPVRGSRHGGRVRHPKDVGDRSTLAIILALRLDGYAILLPFGENTRYDLVTDNGSRLSRVQCKTGRLRDGAVRFATCSNYGHHSNPQTARRDYAGQIDEFAVYCPELGSVYLIPIEDVQTRSEGALRVTPPRNGQRRNVRFAAAYELARIDIF
jgi:hypothetical protein